MATIRSGLRLVAVSAAVVLGLGSVSAAGDADPDETLRLHLGSGTTYVEYSNNGDPITQTITAPKNCQITVNGPLMALSASDKGPGLKDGSIGVKSGGSTGVPCSRVERTEELTLSLGDVQDAVQATLDLELKGDARIQIVLSNDGITIGTFEVRGGGAIVPGQGTDGSTTAPYTATATAVAPIANCREGSDSGPDSGPSDNCFVTIIPSGSFDAVKFRPLSGEMSLEGGGDYGQGTAFDTVFTLQSYDGELGCTQDDNSVTIEEDTVYGQITRLQNTDGSDCVLKPYNLSVDVDADTLSFVPHDNPGAPQPSTYQATLMFAPEATMMPFEGLLEYDQDDDGAAFDWENMPWCTGSPFVTPDATGSIRTSVIPSGHTWCVVDSSTDLAGDGQMRTTWNVVGIGDPKFR